MKIYLRIFLFLVLTQPSFCLEKNTYSISVCTTSSKETANRCKKEILKTSKSETFILKNQDGTYTTYLGIFTTYNEAKESLTNSSNFIKNQKPFIKEIKKFENKEEKELPPKHIQQDIQILNENIDKDIDEKIKEVDKEIKRIEAETQKIKSEIEEKKVKEEQELTERFRKEKEEKDKALAEIQRIKDDKEKQELAEKNRKDKEEEIRKKSEIENQKIKEEKDKALAEIQRIEKEKILAEEQRKKAEIEVQKEQEIRKRIEAETQKIKSEIEEKSSQKLNELNNFENLIIKVDSVKNIMYLKGKYIDGKIVNIKTYKVSTAKTSIKKPLGIGSITSISLNPHWNPTAKTIKVFKERGINLPSIVPFGDKLNYMGAAKINLSHRVNGQEVYRIHGTLSEDTIGTNESSGCIRMKNKEVVELATLLEKFSKTKSFNNISVILE